MTHTIDSTRTQRSYTSNSPPINRTEINISHIPEELYANIFRDLPLDSINAFKCSNRRYHQITNRNAKYIVIEKIKNHVTGHITLRDLIEYANIMRVSFLHDDFSEVLLYIKKLDLSELYEENIFLFLAKRINPPEHLLTDFGIKDRKASMLSFLLKEILKRCPNLKEKIKIPVECLNLDLRDTDNLDLIEFNEKLQFLNLENCQNLTNLNIRLPLKLKRLILKKCIRVAELDSLSSASELEDLDLQGCISLRNFGLIKFSNTLKTINLTGCINLLSISAVTHLPNLKNLILDDCSEAAHINNIQIQTLEKLSLKNCKVTDISFVFFLTRLKELSLEGCSYLSNINPVRSLTGLEVLNLKDCTNLTTIDLLQHLPILKVLNLHGCMKLTAIDSLQSIQTLMWLSLENCPRITSINDFQIPLSVTHFYLAKNTIDHNTCLNRKIDGPSSKRSFLENSTHFFLMGVEHLTHLHGLHFSEKLTVFDLTDCEGMENLPELIQTIQIPRYISHLVLSRKIHPKESEIPSSARPLFIDGAHHLTSIDNLQLPPELESLYIIYCEKLNSINNIKLPSPLKKIKIEFCDQITNFNDLRLPENLESFTANGLPKLSDINITMPPNLVSLVLGTFEHLEHIRRLEMPETLDSLTITNCVNLLHIDNIRIPSKLKKMSLSVCRKIDISNIHFPDSIEHLSLMTVPMRDLFPLATLRNLNFLNLTHCRNLIDISVFRRLTNLTQLFLLGPDELIDIEPIGYLDQLKQLEFGKCAKVKDLTPLLNLKNIRSVGLNVADGVDTTLVMEHFKLLEAEAFKWD